MNNNEDADGYRVIDITHSYYQIFPSGSFRLQHNMNYSCAPNDKPSAVNTFQLISSVSLHSTGR